MRKILPEKLFKSDIVRNSSILLSGNVLGQAIALLVYPILTRLFSEGDFGILATLTSLTGLLTILGTGRYEEALVIAKNKKETSLLLGFSLKLLSVFSLLILAILFFIRQPILELLNMEKLEPFWYYIPPIVFISGLLFLLINLAIREKKFKTIASASLIQNIANSIIRLITGFLSFTKIGLVFSYLSSSVISTFIYSSLRKFIFESLKGKWSEEKKMAWQYRDFPCFNVGRIFISSFSLNLPFLLLIGFYGEVKLGLYSLAFSLLYRPINLISNSLFSALFENTASSERERKPILPVLKKYWKLLCMYILPLFAIAFVVAKPLFSFIFGSDWTESGTYFQYLLPWMFMTMMASPFNFIPLIFNKQNKALWIEIIYLIIRLISLYIGIYYSNFQLGILLFSITGLILTSILIIWYYKLTLKYEKEFIAEEKKL